MSAERSGFLTTMMAVLWSFAGIRRSADYQADSRRLRPIHVILAGVVGGLIFVLSLVAIVHFVLAQA